MCLLIRGFSFFVLRPAGLFAGWLSPVRHAAHGGDMIGHDEQTDRLGALREEVAQPRRAVSSHALVDQAIGVVVTVGG
jgi:hypothetical protein